MGSFPPKRFGVFFLSLSPRPPSPPIWAKEVLAEAAITKTASNIKNRFELCTDLPPGRN
jgi:hypothetical protein